VAIPEVLYECEPSVNLSALHVDPKTIIEVLLQAFTVLTIITYSVC